MGLPAEAAVATPAPGAVLPVTPRGGESAPLPVTQTRPRAPAESAPPGKHEGYLEPGYPALQA